MRTQPTPVQKLPFQLGKPRSFGSLTIVPLFPGHEPRLEYVGLDEAVARGLTVSEVDEHGDVQALRLVNPLAELVLLYEGEELVGAKQNRIVARTALAAAGSELRLPVHCVEHGRWAEPTEALAPAPQVAYPKLRAARHRGGGQVEVWASVAAKAESLDAHAPTGAQDAIYRQHQGTLDAYLEALPRLHGQCGAIVGIGGKVVCLDYVSRPDVFAGLYAKLLRGYALDAIERPAGHGLGAAAVSSFLRGIDRDAVHLIKPVGSGSEGRFAGKVRGAELTCDGELVALTVVPS